jgi:small subunit ribosomal protein S30e
LNDQSKSKGKTNENENSNHFISPIIMGKQHGSIAQAGKVRLNTPKVDKTSHHRTPRGRAGLRVTYNKRFLSRNPDAPMHYNPQD